MMGGIRGCDCCPVWNGLSAAEPLLKGDSGVETCHKLLLWATADCVHVQCKLTGIQQAGLL